jgi:flagellar protein FlaF
MSETEVETLSIAEQEAFGLTQAAVVLDQARVSRDKDMAGLVSALDHNLQLWVAIRTLVSRPDSKLPGQIRDNLVKLSNFVADTILAKGAQIDDASINTIININTQIAEGLLEGQAKG